MGKSKIVFYLLLVLWINIISNILYVKNQHGELSNEIHFRDLYDGVINNYSLFLKNWVQGRVNKGEEIFAYFEKDKTPKCFLQNQKLQRYCQWILHLLNETQNLWEQLKIWGMQTKFKIVNINKACNKLYTRIFLLESFQFMFEKQSRIPYGKRKNIDNNEVVRKVRVSEMKNSSSVEKGKASLEDDEQSSELFIISKLKNMWKQIYEPDPRNIINQRSISIAKNIYLVEDRLCQTQIRIMRNLGDKNFDYYGDDNYYTEDDEASENEDMDDTDDIENMDDMDDIGDSEDELARLYALMNLNSDDNIGKYYNYSGSINGNDSGYDGDYGGDDEDYGGDDGDDDHKDYNYNDIEIYGMSEEELDEDFDKVTPGTAKTKKEDAEEETYVDSTPSITNKKHVYDFSLILLPTNAKSQISRIKGEVKEPFTEVIITCPLKTEEENFKLITYEPEKAPFVVYYEDTQTLKEKKLSEMIPGIIIPPKVSGKKNSFANKSIQFIFPPHVKTEATLFVVCDNSKTTSSDLKGHRGLVEITVKPYGDIFKGCDYSNKEKGYFEKLIDLTPEGAHPCFIQAQANDIIGIKFPANLKTTTCFEQMSTMISDLEDEDSDTQDINNIITGSITYNKDLSEKYFNTKYVHIPLSFRKNINLSCTIQLNDDKIFPVYISVNQEINMSVFNLFDTFKIMHKEILAASSVVGKPNESMCDFGVNLKKQHEETNKIVICRKKLKEFDKITIKCDKTSETYPNIKFLSTITATEARAFEIDTHFQLHIAQKFFGLPSRNMRMLNLYPPYFSLLFEGILRKELMTSSKLRKYLNTAVVSERDGTMQAEYAILKKYIEDLEKHDLKATMPEMKITVGADPQMYEVSLEIPPIISSNPLYLLIGCDNTSDKDGNMGIVELFIAKTEHVLKGCNFHETKVSYLTQNIVSGTHECLIDAYADDIIGLNCIDQSKTDISGDDPKLLPDTCFTQVYKDDTDSSPVDINTIIAGALVYNFNEKKTPAFLKVPQHELAEDKKVNCSCEVASHKKTIKITFKKKSEVKPKTEVKQNSKLDDYTMICPDRDTVLPKQRRMSNHDMEYICEVATIPGFYYVEIFCPKKDHAIFSDVKLYYNTKKPNVKNENTAFDETALQTLVPYSEILYKAQFRKGRTIKQKIDLSHMYLFFPAYVAEEVDFTIVCDNSDTIIDNFKGEKHTYHIEIKKAEVEKVRGCDFSGKSSPMFKDKASDKVCTIDVNPKERIGFVCPPNTIKLSKCFKEVFVENKLTDLFEEMKIKNNLANYTYTHNFNYLIIPPIVKKSITFSCYCVNLKKSDTTKYGFISYNNLKPIYKKLSLDYTQFEENRYKNLETIQYVHTPLSEAGNKIKQLFDQIDLNKPKEPSLDNPLTIVLDKLATFHDEEEGEGDEAFTEEVEDYEFIEDTMTKDILDNIENMNAAEYETYTLTVNIKAPSLIEPEQEKDQKYVCDFSRDNLIIKSDMDTNKKDIHCFVPLEPLDTLTVVFPTLKTTYDAKVGTLQAEEKAALKEVNTYPKTHTVSGLSPEKVNKFEFTDMVINDDSLSGQIIKPFSFTEADFQKAFDSIVYNPKDLFEKVLDENASDAEKDTTTILPGALFTKMEIMDEKYPFYSSASIIIPPVSNNDILIKVVCDNSGYKNEDKHVGYVGLVHIMISKNVNKIKGCDFSAAESDMFIQAKALVESETKECAVMVVRGEYFGIKCPNDADLTPEKCFTEVLVEPDSTNKKSIELFPTIVTYSLSSMTKPKYAYAKIPADNLFKVKFHCTCKKADNVTIGKMEVTYSAAEPELAKAKVFTAKTKKGLHVCDFLNNTELAITDNDDIVVCKMAPTLFSEVQIIYPDFSKNETVQYRLDPVDEHKRLNFYSDTKNIIPAWEALPGSFGHRHFTFVRAKDSVSGEGYSFFVPPIRHDLNLLLYIVNATTSSDIKKKAYVFIYIKKNVSSLIKGCDFTNSENVLTNNLKIAKKSDPCTIKIKKGDVFGIICPKAASLIPHACFNEVILEYYKPKNENAELQTYLHDLKYNMKPKEIMQYLRELQSELDKLKNYLESSNITRLLGFHNVGLFDIPSDHKQYFTAAYSKVPDNFDAIISFSCYCYKSDDNTFGTMNVESGVSEVQEDAPADQGPNIILPFVEKAEEHVNLKDQKPQKEINKVPLENALQNSINYTCDSTKNDILSLVGDKGVISYCDIQANAMDIVTIKCPPVHDTQLAVYKTDSPDTPVDLESATTEEDLKSKKLIIDMNRKKYPVYHDDDNLFSLKDLYMNHFYGFYKTDAEHLEKLKKHSSTTESFFPNHLGEYVYESNMAIKIKNLLPGTVFLKGSLDDKTIEPMGDVIKNGVFSFLIPPHIKEDVQFHAVCTKQANLPTTQDKISKMVVIVHIAANKNMIQGCDFINEYDANSLHPPQFINIKSADANHCIVQLVPNEVLGINCPSTLLKPQNCFKEVFKTAKTETAVVVEDVTKAENKVSLNTLIEHVYVVENNEDTRNSYAYLILPSLLPTTLDPTQMLVCTCGKRTMQMVVDKKYINKAEMKEITHGNCIYNVLKKEVICDIIEPLKADPTTSNKIVEYEVTLSRWYSLTIKYPTIRKVGYESMIVNPLNLKKKVLFKNRPTDLETILPGCIMKHEKDSINRNQISKVRIPPYVGKDVDYFLEFKNSTVTEFQQQQITHHSFVRIHVRIKEGYSIINGCDFTGNYSNLFKFKHTPKTKEEKTCNVTIGPNEFTGFSCLSYQKIKPNNCFASVYENTTKRTVKHIREMSAHAEFDYIMQNSAGYSISYIMFKKEEKNKLTFSCMCKSKFALYTINVVYDPIIDTSVTISDRATVEYLDKDNEEHKKYFLSQNPVASAA